MLKRLNRLWRILATGFCFAFFFGTALAQTLFILPLYSLWLGKSPEKTRKIRRLQQLNFACFVKLMEVLGLIRVTLHNSALLQRSAGCIVIANHPSLIDVVILFARLPEANCVVKSALWQNWFTRGVMRSAGFISNGSADELLQGCKQALAEGQAVLIFPEGSRTIPGQPLQFKRGVANVAVRTGAPLLTAFITCKPLMLTKGEKWYQVPPSKGHFNVYLQETLEPHALIEDFDDKPKAARLLTDHLEQYFEEGLKSYD
ncbi:1-acyl-sn-glycerol-3-phosphate acyltransferase [Gilvimarinus agarilyticus]|uniref:lysophospholipid acyltransferase family protein n=1 Tax=unclassified Gilvimarinus TaxID=2642066 RepID=UPI001C09A959|nr:MULTISPECIES: lysophospholipid acyltransferase family protein [unclassified Gilvimarinus]MBU2885715.1 1-acyl-sn-glycerol-3-phosphate acyltransferase [Gilvimarinus agarilyticus]MDO6570575.1 lysophospholipid acyltransferase family protein [Gilvimarinus sp. 2_MG-2023]MDO6748505.1 lysophospholipid acyltransferase family protein [Gilvimarinus sp. 1_MG-2023]